MYMKKSPCYFKSTMLLYKM